MKRSLILAALVGLVAACASAPKLPPKAGPEEVQLLDPNVGQYPDEGYQTIGPVRAELPLGSANADLLMALRANAARLGADAVILQRIRRTSEGDASVSMDREERIIAEGLAVYWPREPGT